MKRLLQLLVVCLMIAGLAPAFISAQENAATDPDTVESISTECCKTPNEFDSKSSGVRKTGVSIKAEPSDSNEIIVVKETSDTVFVVKTSDFRSALREGESKVKIFSERGYGVSGGPTPGIYAINMGPIKELLRSGYPRRGVSFDFGKFDYQAFKMGGGMGYIGLGNGLRIGGGGMGGHRKFVSEPFSGDSSVVLETRVNFGGFLVEKAGIKERLTYLVGGFIGGGNFDVSHRIIDNANLTFFEPLASGLDDTDLKADFMSLELHGGFTYSFFPFFHLGLDVSVPLFLSSDGFTPFTSEFATINTGMRIRFIFGNLG